MDLHINPKFYDGEPEDFDRYCQKTYGAPTAKLIARRLEHVKAAENLAVLMKQGFPGRWHWLTGNRKHQISADLKDLKRLIFIPIEEPKDFLDSAGNLDNRRIHGLVVWEIADTHNE